MLPDWRRLALTLVVTWFVAIACGSPGSGPSCGNSLVDEGERCDDGNTASGDGCTSQCGLEAGFDCYAGEPCTEVCGDGLVVGREVCDDGSLVGLPINHCPGCDMLDGRCGDGIVQSNWETCDPSGTDPGCNAASCQAVFGATCDPVANRCHQSELPADLRFPDFTEEDKVQFCTWLSGLVGEPGTEINCNNIIYAVRPVEQCTSMLAVFAFCTVGELEAFVASMRDRCDLVTATYPPCAS